MGDTEVKNRKVNRNKAKNEKNKEIPNPAIDPRYEVMRRSIVKLKFLFYEMQLLFLQ